MHPLEQAGDAALKIHHNEHEGKIGVLCLAPEEGLGIDDPERRDSIGEDRITFFRRTAAEGIMGRMMLTEIDHVAIAVRDLDAAVDYYQRAFGATVDHREVVEKDGVEELLKVAESYIQLLTPTREDSPVAKAIEKRGEGLHHVGYRADDCAEALAAMIAAGATPIDQAPPGQPRDHRGLHPPEGQLRDADRARPGVAGAVARPERGHLGRSGTREPGEGAWR